MAFTEFGQVLPGAGDAGHDRLAAELAVGADLAGDARHLGGERAQLIDHRVDGFLELQDLAAHVDRDLLRQVAVGHGDRHLGDVAHLGGEVRGHGVDALGQLAPHAGHLAHLSLAAELAFGADLARDARHFRGEHVELLDHAVDDLGRAQEFALQRSAVDVELHGLQEIALRHGGDGARHLGGRPQQIVDERVDRRFHLAPGALGEAETHTLASLALTAHDLTDTFKLLGDALVGGHDFVEGVGNLAHDADLVAGHAHGKIPHAHGLQRVQQLAKFPVFAPVDLRQARLVERAGGRTIGVRGAGDVGGLFHGNLLIPRLCGAVGIVRRGRDLT